MRPQVCLFAPLQTQFVCVQLQSEHWCAGDLVSSESSPTAANGKPGSIQIRNGRRMVSQTHSSRFAKPGSLAAMTALLHPIFFLQRAELLGERGRMRERKVDKNAECW